MPTRRRRAKWEANRQFEEALTRLGSSDIAIDCGANVGKFTEMMARTGAKVHAFEPDPYCVDVLREKFKDWPNVVLHAEAVGTEEAEVKLFRSIGFSDNPRRLSTSSSLFSEKRNRDKEAPVTVNQVDLGAFISDLPKSVSLLKMDIEGGEVPILLNFLERGLIEKIDRLFVETHEKQIPLLAQETRMLREEIKKRNHLHVNLDWR